MIYEELKILFDCGVNSSFDVSNYKAHQNLLSDLDLILVSSPEIKSCGALPYLINKHSFLNNIFTAVPTKYLINVNMTL